MARLTNIEHLPAPKRVLSKISVIHRIDSFLEDLNSEPRNISTEMVIHSSRKTEIFHSSTIGSLSGKSLCGKYPMGCGRQLYYDLTGAQAEGAWEPRMRRLLDTGTAIHTQLQAYLEMIAADSEGRETFTPEAVISPERSEVADRMDISGHTDGIYTIDDGEDQIRFCIEIKTINDAGYAKTSGAHQEHIIQATNYLKCLDIPVMLFLYYNKNDSSMAEFIYEFDVRRWTAIERKLNKVRECAFKDVPPEQEPGWHCSNCKYKGVCKPPRRGRGTTRTKAFNKQRKS